MKQIDKTYFSRNLAVGRFLVKVLILKIKKDTDWCPIITFVVSKEISFCLELFHDDLFG